MGIVSASVLTKSPLADYYLTYITDPNVPFTAVVEMSAMVDRRHFKGASLLYLPKYVSPEDPLFDQTDAEIQDSFLGALERMYPNFQRSDVIVFQVSRVREVFSIPTLGYSENIPSFETSIPGLYIVNSAQIVNGTLNANETIRIAKSVASELTGQAQ
jgi:protoporphyrinogen oxidase